MKIDTGQFCIKTDAKVSLRDLPTRIEPVYKDDHDYGRLLKDHIAALSDRQDRLFAASRQSLLVIFQAMDAAGKDGAIKHVMSGVNPQGCQVYSFKHPGPIELEHDFLWRFQPCLPARGRIGIFNRSYYEEVLIARVHPDILVNEEQVDVGANPKSVFEGRYESIRNFEDHLHRSGVRIVKIFLHLSKDEQRRRFLARIDSPDKNWKLGLADMEERKFWPRYTDAYECAISATASPSAPWFVVPADDKPNARLITSQILLDAFDLLDLSLPAATPKRRQELEAFRAALLAETDVATGAPNTR